MKYLKKLLNFFPKLLNVRFAPGKGGGEVVTEATPTRFINLTLVRASMCYSFYLVNYGMKGYSLTNANPIQTKKKKKSEGERESKMEVV